MGNDVKRSGGEEQILSQHRPVGESGNRRRRLPAQRSPSTGISAAAKGSHASQVSGVSALHAKAGNAVVKEHMRSRGEGISAVGGTAKDVIYVPSGTGQAGDVIGPGETGYALHMLPDVARRGAALAAGAAGLKLVPVEPDFAGLDRRVEWASEQTAKYTEDADHWYTSYSWTKRDKATVKALADHLVLLETQRSLERMKFAEFKAWVPRANDWLLSAGRLDAMQEILGVSDPAAMVTAVRQQLQIAQTLAVRAQTRAASGKAGGADIDVPALDASVQSTEAEVANAARAMRVSWLGLEQNVLAQRGEKVHEEGAAAEKELKEIEEVKEFVRDVGKTVEISLALMEGVPAMGEAFTAELTEEGVVDTASRRSKIKKEGLSLAKDVGIPTTPEGIGGAIVDFIYYDQIRELKYTLSKIKAKCDAISGAAGAIEIRQRADDFEVKVDAFALKSAQLRDRVSSRQQAYLRLGRQLDVAARTYPDLMRPGAALPKGRERFTTVLLVTSQIRELLAIGEGARESFDLPENFQAWALDLDQERRTPSSFGELLGNWWGGLSKEELLSLGKIFGQIKGFSHNVDEMHKMLDPVDEAARQLIQSLTGGEGGKY